MIEMLQSGFGNSLVHRLPPAIKLLVLILASLALFILPSFALIITAAAVTVGLYLFAGFVAIEPLRRLRPIWWLLMGLFFVGLFSGGWQQGVIVSFRLATILCLAGLITATTPVTAMMTAFERGFVVLKPIGLNPAKMALVLSLTLRFIPVLAQIIAEVREAQQARGLERSLISLVIPVLIRMLRMSDDVASAIEARSYDV